jgi:ribosomal protein S12 methylthiotransferase accessory factor YcaO
MQINSNLKASNVGPATPTKAAARTTPTESSGASFSAAAALETALSEVPDVRADAVQRAKALIGDAHYPPNATIKQLASFFADKLTQPAE